MPITLNTIDDLILFSHQSKCWEVLQFAIECKLFEMIPPEGISIPNLVKALKCSTEPFKVALGLLALMGLLNIDNAHISLTPLSQRYLTDQHQHNHATLLLHHHQTHFCAKRYYEILGIEPPEQPSSEIQYMSAMDTANRYAALLFSSRVLKNKNGTLLDLGCGSGIFSRTACQQNKSLHAVCVDFREMLFYLDNIISEDADLSERITLLEGDVLTLHLKKSSVHSILMSNLLHFFQAEKIDQLLSQCHDWLSDQGEIIIHDIFSMAPDIYSHLFSLEWLSNGNTFANTNDMQAHLVKNGFTSINIKSYPKLPTTFIHAIKAS